MDDYSLLVLIVMMSPFLLVIGFCLMEVIKLNLYRPPADQKWQKR
jgi:hypothetical protein